MNELNKIGRSTIHPSDLFHDKYFKDPSFTGHSRTRVSETYSQVTLKVGPGLSLKTWLLGESRFTTEVGLVKSLVWSSGMT